jgi:hypothetical protein
MITKDEAFDQLVEVCPSYFAASDLDRYVEAFEDPDLPDLFVRTSALALHVVEVAAAPNGASLEPFFATVETIVAEGDEEAVELVELGLIEALQNVTSHQDVVVSPSAVRDQLGPAALRIWDEHDQLWRDAAKWRHGGPRVDESDYGAITDADLRRYFQSHKRLMGDGVLIGASDIVHYQTELRDMSALHPARRGRVPWAAILVGLTLAIALAIAIYR